MQNAKQQEQKAIVDKIFSDPTTREVLEQWDGRYIRRRYATYQKSPGGDRDRFHQSAVELWRAHLRWKLGSYAALLDAFDICRAEKLPLPDWLRDLLEEKLLNAMNAPRALVEREAATFRQQARLHEQKHFQLVSALGAYERWPEFRQSPDDYKSRTLYPREVREVEQAEAEEAFSWQKKFRIVERLLADGPRSNSFDAIAKNYQLVKNRALEDFGVQIGVYQLAIYGVWDIAFLRPNTETSLKLVYSQ